MKVHKIITIAEAQVGMHVTKVYKSTGLSVNPNSELVRKTLLNRNNPHYIVCFKDFEPDFVHIYKEKTLLEIEIEDTTIYRSTYPHVCPRCGKPAYVGLNNVDCSNNCEIK